MEVLGQNLGEKAAGVLMVAGMNKEYAKNIFFKSPYGLQNTLMSKSSVPLIERLVIHVVRPAVYSSIAFKSGVYLGAGIKGFYYEFKPK